MVWVSHGKFLFQAVTGFPRVPVADEIAMSADGAARRISKPRSGPFGFSVRSNTHVAMRQFGLADANRVSFYLQPLDLGRKRQGLC